MLNTFRTVLLLTVAFGAYYFLDVGSAFRARRAPSETKTFCSRAGMVALTFDEGPGPMTLNVLAALSIAKINVTFHVVTSYINTIAVVTNLQTADASGHLIGLRFPTALKPSEMSAAAFRQTLIAESSKIFQHIGKYPKFLRLPSGQYDNTHVGMAAELGFIVTEWNVDSNDYALDAKTGLEQMKAPFADEFRKVPAGAGRYISLHHDLAGVYEDQTNLIELAKWIKTFNYKMVKLDECFGSEGYRTNNGPSAGPSPGPSGGGGTPPAADTPITVKSDAETLFRPLFLMLLTFLVALML